MRPFRASIAGLLAAIAFCGIAFTALIHPSRLWSNAFFSLTTASLTIAVLGAVFGRGRRLAFRVGFSTCGWAYFLATLGPGPFPGQEPNLLSSAILDILYPYTVPRPTMGPTMGPAPVPPTASSVGRRGTSDGDGNVILAGAFGGPTFVTPTPWEIWTKPDRTIIYNGFTARSPLTYRTIGHSLFCLGFALVGGVLTGRFREHREAEEADRDRGSPG